MTQCEGSTIRARRGGGVKGSGGGAVRHSTARAMEVQGALLDPYTRTVEEARVPVTDASRAPVCVVRDGAGGAALATNAATIERYLRCPGPAAHLTKLGENQGCSLWALHAFSWGDHEPGVVLGGLTFRGRVVLCKWSGTQPWPLDVDNLRRGVRWTDAWH